MKSIPSLSQRMTGQVGFPLFSIMKKPSLGHDGDILQKQSTYQDGIPAYQGDGCWFRGSKSSCPNASNSCASIASTACFNADASRYPDLRKDSAFAIPSPRNVDHASPQRVS